MFVSGVVVIGILFVLMMGAAVFDHYEQKRHFEETRRARFNKLPLKPSGR